MDLIKLFKFIKLLDFFLKIIIFMNIFYSKNKNVYLSLVGMHVFIQNSYCASMKFELLNLWVNCTEVSEKNTKKFIIPLKKKEYRFKNEP